MRFNLSNDDEYNKAHELLVSELMKESTVEIKVINKQRTLRQNSALHLMFAHLSDDLNDSGLYMQKVLKAGVEIQWTPELVKKYLWAPLQKAITNKSSSAELDTKEVDQVFEVLNKHLSEKLGISIEFPSIEAIINKSSSNDDNSAVYVKLID